MRAMHSATAGVLALLLASLPPGGARAAGGAVVHDAGQKTLEITDGTGELALRLRYDGRCLIDRLAVRGRQVVPEATGICSHLRVGGEERTTRSGIPAPVVSASASGAIVSGIRFGAGGIEVEETWTFSAGADGISWRIARRYLSGGEVEDTYFPGFDFNGPDTWTGALLSTGGVAWFRLFDTPVATYGVHAGTVTFWSKEAGACLRISPSVPPGEHIAARFSRHPHGVLSFNYSVTEEELATRHGLARFLRDLYRERLVAKAKVDIDLWRRHVEYLERFLSRTTHAEEAERLGIPARLEQARRTLARVRDPAYLRELEGTIGAQPGLR